MVFLRCIDTACATVPVPFESSADLERVVTVISALVPNLAAVAIATVPLARRRWGRALAAAAALAAGERWRSSRCFSAAPRRPELRDAPADPAVRERPRRPGESAGRGRGGGPAPDGRLARALGGGDRLGTARRRRGRARPRARRVGARRARAAAARGQLLRARVAAARARRAGAPRRARVLVDFLAVVAAADAARARAIARRLFAAAGFDGRVPYLSEASSDALDYGRRAARSIGSSRARCRGGGGGSRARFAARRRDDLARDRVVGRTARRALGLHADPDPTNVLHQLHGEKVVRLYAPWWRANLYASARFDGGGTCSAVDVFARDDSGDGGGGGDAATRTRCSARRGS